MRDLYSDVTARIVQHMEAGVMPWEREWSATKVVRGSMFPTNATTNRPYSGINVILLWMAPNRGLPRYLTYKQAQSVGGNVRKGEHGSKVYFYKQLNVKDKKTGDEKKIPMLKEYTVFHVSQCDNLPEHVIHGPGATVAAPVSENERMELADAFIASTKADFREGAGRPSYIPSRDCIMMPALSAFKSSPSFYETAFHELTHWTGAKHRLARDFSGRFGTASYAAEELVAELGAAFINADFGFEQEKRNAAYISSWIKLLKDDARAIFTAASKASKAVEYLRGIALADDEPGDDAIAA